ncbi:MAG: MBL fold metallo-hydrolase [Petrimonas sp.]|jgi:glyoxylase-like metal-dependent hydrolase (beta-lactamase superfamily II)|uniref:MBL fold metallo-hydrolase n=1 Tax=Petrimonas TaxID=307628 RepID=UPI000E8AD95B|nr:MBL fold metallo-hydrolase [Petrimonas sp.]NLU29451.1 MBL fold metallo-hydrolase [Bacteroidales bacterium]HAC72276.1 MBL fold hydrolase [Porphyromonadaceae bacterium]MDD2910277.1 MBL fold metallo-hydrolase [Petrimonas sp.]MDD4015953.1 MBL fold metallo-hydrolase [Petrimonas sp.]
MKIKTFEFNPLGVNTYVLYDRTGECIVVDASCFFPDENKLLLNFILDNNLVVKHLVNTHLHFDHIFGVNFLASQFGLKLLVHRDDIVLLENLSQQLQLFGFNTNVDYRPEIGGFLAENDVVSFGEQQLKVLHVPGHSPGSIVFYNEKEKLALVGDVLFNGSIGRTDLLEGSFEQLTEGIRTKLFTFPDDTEVYPGHGPKTTIGQERRYNPFVGTGS